MPVLVVDLDEAEADKLLLTLDPLAAMAEVDGERIQSLLETVQTNDKASRHYCGALPASRSGGCCIRRTTRQYQAVELQYKWQTASGQLWRIGEHRLAMRRLYPSNRRRTIDAG